MVEATNQSLDVKLSLDLTAQGKSPIYKRVQASNYETLIAAANKLAAKHEISPNEIKLRYHDGDNWVVVEDDNDVQMAFQLAGNNSGVKLIFAIRQTNTSFPPAEAEEEVKGGKVKKPKVEKLGIPRKAIKNLINKELEKQAQELFQRLLQSEDFADVDMTAQEAEAVHEGVFCNGCPERKPIRGIRYKSTIKKNFDLCAPCEERQGHDHAMLKIRTPGEAPDVMVVIDEEEPQEERKGGKLHRNQDPMRFIGQMLKSFGQGGREGTTRGGKGMGKNGNPFKHMVNEFLHKFKNGECQTWTDEQWQEKVRECGPQWNENMSTQWNFQGKQSWKEARAVCQRKPEQTIEIIPGTTETVELEILNDTYWPWKPNCTLTLSDNQPSFELPIDIFSLPVEQEVRGKAKATFSVPLTVSEHVTPDENAEYGVNLTFRGPAGMAFGADIPLKIKCVLNKTPVVTDLDIYKLAIKLHEQLQLGSLDDCLEVVRKNNGNEQESIKELQRKN